MQSAGGIYSTVTDAGTSYDKAEAFAYDVALMMMSVFFLKGAVVLGTKSLSTCKSVVQDLIGRTTRVEPLKVIQGAKGIETITSLEEFLECVKGFLNEDALQYAKELLNNDADDIVELKKIARLMENGSRKIGKKLSKEELKAGLDALWDDGGVEGALAAIEKYCQRKISVQTISNKFPNDNQTGKIFNYTLENGNIRLENGIHEVDFVVDMNGNLRLGSGHSYLAEGNSVQAAGKMKINSQGRVRLITNESGHYQPTVEQALNYPGILQKAGLNIDKSWILVKAFEFSSSNYVIDSKVLYNGPIKYMPK